MNNKYISFSLQLMVHPGERESAYVHIYIHTYMCDIWSNNNTIFSHTYIKELMVCKIRLLVLEAGRRLGCL